MLPVAKKQSPLMAVWSFSSMPAIDASMHWESLEIHSAIGSPPVWEVLDDSRVPDPVVRNHSSADSAPVPPKYPPGMLTCELVPLKLAAVPSGKPVGPAAPRVTLA